MSSVEEKRSKKKTRNIYFSYPSFGLLLTGALFSSHVDTQAPSLVRTILFPIPHERTSVRMRLDERGSRGSSSAHKLLPVKPLYGIKREPAAA